MNNGITMLSGDATRSGSTALADVTPDGGGGTPLRFAVGSGKTCFAVYTVPYRSSDIACGIALGLNGPASPTRFGCLYDIATAVTTSVRGQQKAYDQNTPATAIDVTGDDTFARLIAAIKDSGGGGGNLQARFAPETTTGSPTVTVRQGANVVWEEIVNASGRHYILSGDTAASSSSTPADVAPSGGGGQNLSFPVEANADYDFTFGVWYRSSVSGTGIGLGLNGPAAGALEAMLMIGRQPMALTYESVVAYDQMIDGPNVETINVDNFAIITGIYRGGANAGNVIARYAREAAAASGAVTVMADSFVIYQKRA